MKATPRITGIIPAAGHARRLGQRDQSKEVLPVPDNDQSRNPQPVAAYLIDQMSRAGAEQVYFVIRPGKWDIIETFGHGGDGQPDFAYLMMNRPDGPPFTVNQASGFVKDSLVLMGFPDILIWPADAFAKALESLAKSDADVVLGTFNATQADGCDRVEFDAAHRVTRITPKELKPQWPEAACAWIFAVWRPRFTEYLADQIRQASTQVDAEWPFGIILSRALTDGLHIDAMHFDNGRFLDIGEPQRLALANQFPGVGGS